ncbi:hypothetical protein ACFU3J_02250 [Streptomyces sp. NPDC057411]|uniref:hypothetical protein n=1 Tax=unclassified Streptomyces TaxID=2593676 RepID=UPI0036316C2E
MSVEPSGYEKAAPIVSAHMEKIERAVSATRAGYAGCPYDVVRAALVVALDAEGAERVVPGVVDSLAGQIAGGGAGGAD